MRRVALPWMRVAVTHPYRVSKVRRLARYLAGRPLGVPKTNATFLRAADLVLIPGGRAGAWSRAAGWKRAVVRALPLAAGGAAVTHLLAPVTTDLAVSFLAATGTGYTVWRGRRYLRGRRHYRQVLRPLAQALQVPTELPTAELLRRLVLPAEPGDRGRVPLADHFPGRAADVAEIARIYGQRVGGEWDTALQLREAPFYLALAPRPAPPGSVAFDDVRALCAATTQDRPLLGLGTRGDPIYLDFTGEIAHLAASIGTGGGKSSFLRFLVAQFAHHGVRDFTVMDVKWVSLAGMEAVPGLKIHRDVEDIWDALALARADMDLRYRQLLDDPGTVFPRRVLIMEEQNAFALETAIRWREVREPGDKRNTAPVWNDIALLLVKARQVNINIIGVYQRMSAEASGGGTYRDQYGLKLLSRFSPAAWDTLVGTRPRGVSSAVPGRAIAILGGSHRQVQLPFISVAQALDFATSGPPSVVSETGSERPVHAGGSPVDDIQAPLITVKDAVRVGLIPGTVGAAAQRMQRDPDRPAARGKQGNAALYRRSELAAWADRHSTPTR